LCSSAKRPLQPENLARLVRDRHNHVFFQADSDGFRSIGGFRKLRLRTPENFAGIHQLMDATRRDLIQI
jgi:hypothetical protein